MTPTNLFRLMDWYIAYREATGRRPDAYAHIQQMQRHIAWDKRRAAPGFERGRIATDAQGRLPVRTIEESHAAIMREAGIGEVEV